ncbi:MAG: hypothetical protein EU539_14180 [Promethearchaeota archaeon]|nr:MAG: hypothetical protein EU539_14180 [Candidatus Lokiarchaeota archaeon]
MPSTISIDIFTAFFSFVFVSISWIFSISMISKYFKYKTRQFLYVAVAWIGVASPWTSDAISLIMILIIGVPLNLYAKVIIELPFIPIAIYFWLETFTDIKFTQYRKSILNTFLIITAIFETFFFMAIFMNFELIGAPVPPIGIVYTPIIYAFLMTFLGVFVITGILFAKETLESENKEMVLKGKFLILAFLSYMTGIFLEIILPPIPLLVILIKLVLISSAVEYYTGFILPNFVKELISKKKT